MQVVREVEVKFAIGEAGPAVAALEGRGARFGPVVVQEDQAYAPAAWSYGQSKIGVPFLRLRTVAGRHSFTMKRPLENALSCEEHEVEVSDRSAMHAAILAMGFAPTVAIVKRRRTAAWPYARQEGAPATVVCLDDVSGAGVFLELERMVPDGVDGEAVQAELVDAVAGLGITAERTRETYDSLIRARQLA